MRKDAQQAPLAAQKNGASWCSALVQMSAVLVQISGALVAHYCAVQMSALVAHF